MGALYYKFTKSLLFYSYYYFAKVMLLWHPLTYLHYITYIITKKLLKKPNMTCDKGFKDPVHLISP